MCIIYRLYVLDWEVDYGWIFFNKEIVFCKSLWKFKDDIVGLDYLPLCRGLNMAVALWAQTSLHTTLDESYTPDSHIMIIMMIT